VSDVNKTSFPVVELWLKITYKVKVNGKLHYGNEWLRVRL